MVELNKDHPLYGRKVYVPRMCDGSALLFSAALRGHGIDAMPSPEGDARTRELAAKHLTGDECYPQMVTLGNFLKTTEEENFDPKKTAFFLPTASGPCRFGMYAPLVGKVMEKLGLDDIELLSPTCDNGYRALGEDGSKMMRHAWWGLAAGDQLRKMLHRFRPYETKTGAADKAYKASLDDAATVLAESRTQDKAKFAALVESMKRARQRFNEVPADFSTPRLLVGVVGEIFCRLSTFSNDDIVRRIEAHGGEAWLADIAEWVFYVNYWEREEIRAFGSAWSGRMLKSWLTDKVQHADEHKIAQVFKKELAGREEPESIGEILDYARPWLEPHAALGEMVLNIGKSIYLGKKGVDAVMDISPFSCMNGIVSEALYPKVSKELGGLPIRVFYFDGTSSNVDEEVEIFMELAAHHARETKGGQSKRKAG